MNLKLNPLHPVFVAEASGIDLTKPLADADVRAIAKELGLGSWDKPAAACLSSRIPYGTSVTPERLSQVGGLEAELRALGFRRSRVRYHDKIARIELDLEDLPRLVEPRMREAVVKAGKTHGFTYITLDLAGYRTGSHNEVLQGRSLNTEHPA